jgi:hypothetical protein
MFSGFFGSSTWILSYFAVAGAGLFAGAAVYVSLVEHPARLSGSVAVALAEFGPSYRKGAKMQALLASLASLLAIIAWVGDRQLGWLLGALALIFAILFTLIAIFPVNKKLLDPSLNPEDPQARLLLKRWGNLHFVRSLAGLMAFLTFIACLS